MKNIKITDPKKYLLKYEKSPRETKFYRIAPIDQDQNQVTAYAYADGVTRPGIRSFKKSKILQIDKISS